MSAPPRRPLPGLQITRVDLAAPADRDDLLALLDEYAMGPTGRGAPLEASARAELPGRLAEHAHYLGWLARADGQAIGLVNAFQGVSTFRAEPLINIHDIVVTASWRRRGVARALLDAVADTARARGCCKITLEVLEGNAPALAAYRDAGFVGYALDPSLGRAVFLEKPLY